MHPHVVTTRQTNECSVAVVMVGAAALPPAVALVRQAAPPQWCRCCLNVERGAMGGTKDRSGDVGGNGLVGDGLELLYEGRDSHRGSKVRGARGRKRWRGLGGGGCHRGLNGRGERRHQEGGCALTCRPTRPYSDIGTHAEYWKVRQLVAWNSKCGG